MIFGERALLQAEGCYLAHSFRSADLAFKKGHRLAAGDIEALKKAGVERVIVAELEAFDVHEAAAAQRLGHAVAGAYLRAEPPFTGRVNLFATCDGMLVVESDKVNRLNALAPALTLATLAPYQRVTKGQMVATIKIIPFAVEEKALHAAESLGSMVHLAPFGGKRAVLVASELPGLKGSVMDKTRRLLERRLHRGNAQLIDEIRVPHTMEGVRQGCLQASAHDPDLIIIFGASASVDIEDVSPGGLVAAGGAVVHFGMPVDPGNLLFIGTLGRALVVGAPGCARSPVENGFDWVLNRLMADIAVTREDIMGLGVGGLLMEITSRPQPRAISGPHVKARGRIAAIVLAAGRSQRMGEVNKLLLPLGEAVMVRRVVNALADSKVDEIVVVTGHQEQAVRAALAGVPLRFVHNPDYVDGLSSSLRAGIEALSNDTDGAMIVLGDMPFVSSAAFNRIIDAYQADEDVWVAVASCNGKRGNPVLWSRRFFDALKAIEGDRGARHLLYQNEAVLADVDIGMAAAMDIDTPEALSEAMGRWV